MQTFLTILAVIMVAFIFIGGLLMTLWAIYVLAWFMFGDIIEYHLKIRRAMRDEEEAEEK